MIPGRGSSRDGKQPGGIVRGARGAGGQHRQTGNKGKQDRLREFWRSLKCPGI